MRNSRSARTLLNAVIIVLLLLGQGVSTPARAQELVPAAEQPSQPEMLKDIYTANVSSDPRDFAAHGDLVFFAATDLAHGMEPWVSDGTVEGTHMVKDLIPGEQGSRPYLFTSFDGRMFFASQQENASGLWVTNGTLDETFNIYPGQGVEWMTPNGDWLYFALDSRIIRYGGPDDAFETLTNASLDVGGKYSNSRGLVMNGALYFAAQDSETGNELWRLDLTSLAVSRVLDIFPGSDPVLGGNDANPTNLTVVGNMLFFTAVDGTHGSELWASDGTAGGTRLVREIIPGVTNWGHDQLTAVGDWLYFRAYDGVHGRELWRSDGTYANTHMVVDLAPDAVSGMSGRYSTITSVSGSEVLIPARDAAEGAGNGVELWKIPVTAAGVAASPVMLDIEPGPASSDPSWLVLNGSFVYFAAYDSVGGIELWRSNGTPSGTERVADSIPGADGSNPTFLTVWNGGLVYNGCDGDHGFEPWVSGGTPGSTYMIADVAKGTYSSGSDPSEGVITQVGGKNIRYFSAADALHGRKLWRTDGTEDGTWLVKDYSPWEQQGLVSLHSYNTVAMNGILYFYDFDFEDGTKIYRTDGTAAGTRMLRNPDEDYQAGNPIVATDDTLFFISYPGPGIELWKSDGTDDGTVRVKTLSTEAGVEVRSLQVLGDQVIIGVSTIYASNTFTLWRSNGTEAGTQPISGPSEEYGAMNNQMVIGNRLYFDRADPSDPDGYKRLWVTDGTTPGTYQMPTTGTVKYRNPRLFTVVGNDLYFVAATSSSSYTRQALWKVGEGESSVSLVMLLDYMEPLFLGALSSDRLMYLGQDDDPGFPNQWYVVGLGANTFTPLCNVSYGCYPVFSVDYAIWQGKLYFSATDNEWGEPADRLMVSDGTRAGTSEIKVPGTETSFTYGGDFLSTSDALYFSANDGVHGIEPWVIRGSAGEKIYLPMVRRQ